MEGWSEINALCSIASHTLHTGRKGVGMCLHSSCPCMLGARGRVWDQDYQASCTGMSLRLMLQAVNNLVSAPDPNQPQHRSLPVSPRVYRAAAARGHVTLQTAKSKSILFLEITCYIVYFRSAAHAALAR